MPHIIAKAKRIDLSEIVVHFEALEDPRSSINRRHPLVSVVVIALMAVLGGGRWSDGNSQVGQGERGLAA